MRENLLRDALQRREFVHTAELVLGRDHASQAAEAFVREAAQGPHIRVISVTDLPGGNPALPPEGFVPFIIEQGLTPIAHLTGKDGNRSLLEGRLHALAAAGVENVLALTGDAQKDGFGGEAKPVYDLDSVLILRLIEALRGGMEYRVGARAARMAPFDFFAGAVVNPYKVREPDQMMQLYKLELKIGAGARYIITQLGFNLRKLYELRQYMVREGLGHVPVLANVYVPTAKIARMAQAGELAGCIVPEGLARRLEVEKKPQRLERAALMVAAVRDLGFAGAHIGGFGLSHDDFVTIVERASAIGGDWRGRMGELVYETPGEFYLLPPGPDGLSDPDGDYRFAAGRGSAAMRQRMSRAAHRWLIADETPVARFFSARLASVRGDEANGTTAAVAAAAATNGTNRGANGAAGANGRGGANGATAANGGAGGASRATGANVEPPSHVAGEAGAGDWRHSLWYHLLAPSSLYREALLGCMACGDCVQDHLDYAGCPMRSCYKELRNGPCGGSRPDGSCEARPERPCFWNVVYESARAVGDDPRRFARVLIPPRNWRLNRTNALANRFAGIDNAAGRVRLRSAAGSAGKEGEDRGDADHR